MAQVELPPQRLSEYERAICYYTLPKIAHPVTFGLIVAYALVFIEALALFLYGTLAGSDTIARAGTIALAVIIIFGIVAFLGRGLINEIRMRKALAVAKALPQAIAHVEDIPDPFNKHVLLRHPLHNRGDLFPCTDNEGNIVYYVESASGDAWWKVKDAHDKEAIRVRVQQSAASFSFANNMPKKLSVYQAEREVGQIKRKISFTTPIITVHSNDPKRTYTIQHGNIMLDKQLVGRIYYLHKSIYLDVEQNHMNQALLGLFITMT